MRKENTITFGQEFDGGHLHDLTKTPYIMESWELHLINLYECGWKLRRKVTFSGKDIRYIAGFTRQIDPKAFKYTYHLEYDGDKKCLRIPDFKCSPLRQICSGHYCFYHHKLRSTQGCLI